MSEFTLSPDKISIVIENDALKTYQFDTKIAKHNFCGVCGIYPFHQTMRVPGEYRVNLSCVDEIDSNNLKIEIFQGKDI